MIFAALVLLQGCATPSEKFIDTATEFGFSMQELDGMPYKHRVFINPKAKYVDNIDELHVYLDGDGTPWRSGNRIAEDPTPRNPLILKLMKQDQAPAILLGRPCYYGLSLSESCSNTLWTSDRYASVIVDSMIAALNRWISARKIDHLVLIGFSGGGALATLMAPRLHEVSTVVTIAANLDIKAWSDYHAYLQLSGSFNPMTDAQIPSQIRQIHLAGLKDTNVPASIIESFSAMQKDAIFLPQPEYTHDCCWDKIWSEFLKKYLTQ